MKEIVEGKWQYARFLFDLDGGGECYTEVMDFYGL